MTFPCSSKGQKSGAEAWVLVTLISIAMIGFILFLPEDTRQAVLEGRDVQTSEPGAGTTPEEEAGDLLLERHVGRLEYYPSGPITHPIASVHLFRTTKSTELERYNPFAVERAVFSGTSVTKQFTIKDLSNVENVLLAIEAPERDGELRISLNGRLTAEVSDRGPIAPITLRKDVLQKNNELTFDISSPGWKIWKLHKFHIDSAKIFADVTDPSKQEALTTMTFSPVEANNLLAAELRFNAECDPFDVGALEISVNGRVVYRAVPDCQTTNFASIDAGALRAGANTITFRAEDGEFRLDQMRIETQLEPVQTFIEYFEVDPDLLESIELGGRDIFLEIDFVDDTERKRAELNINGHITTIDQREPFYARNINLWARPGMRNYIEIVPETPLNIVEVRVRVR